jgi:hypothetical protein
MLLRCCNSSFVVPCRGESVWVHFRAPVLTGGGRLFRSETLRSGSGGGGGSSAQCSSLPLQRISPQLTVLRRRHQCELRWGLCCRGS